MNRNAWLRGWWRWAVPLALVLVNLVVLSFYRLIYAGRIAQVETRIEEQRDEVERLEGHRQALEALVERAAASRRGIEALYESSFATEGERLADLIRHVRELATRSGLEPDAIAYPSSELDDHELIKRSIVFSVGGSYADLRTFINLLELSDEFVVLEQVKLNAADPELRISLQLSTLFAGRDLPRADVAGLTVTAEEEA